MSRRVRGRHPPCSHTRLRHVDRSVEPWPVSAPRRFAETREMGPPHQYVRMAPSRPSRARGLKRERVRGRRRKIGASRPSRPRGLKPHEAGPFESPAEVAPLVGAWIETRKWSASGQGCIVALLAGAWVEMTRWTLSCATRSMSRPSRASGLKRQRIRGRRRKTGVARAQVATGRVRWRLACPLGGAFLGTRIEAAACPMRARKAAGVETRRGTR